MSAKRFNIQLQYVFVLSKTDLCRNFTSAHLNSWNLFKLCLNKSLWIFSHCWDDTSIAHLVLKWKNSLFSPAPFCQCDKELMMSLQKKSRWFTVADTAWGRQSDGELNLSIFWLWTYYPQERLSVESHFLQTIQLYKTEVGLLLVRKYSKATSH